MVKIRPEINMTARGVSFLAFISCQHLEVDLHIVILIAINDVNKSTSDYFMTPISSDNHISGVHFSSIAVLCNISHSYCQVRETYDKWSKK